MAVKEEEKLKNQPQEAVQATQPQAQQTTQPEAETPAQATQAQPQATQSQAAQPQAQAAQPQTQTAAQTTQPATSGAVDYAQQLLEQAQKAKPGAYESQWKSQLDGILSKLTNREAFSYDAQSDALYQMYKDQYTQAGKQAMQDTMGQAATLTGGYGNSYAQNVGQQAYNAYLQDLTAKIPGLQAQAYEMYQAEGDDLKDQYSLYSNQEAQDYDRYNDDYSKWNQEYQQAYNRYADERDRQDGLDADAKALAQQQVQYLLSMGVKPNDNLLAQAGYDSQYTDDIYNRVLAEQQAAAASSSGGGGGRKSSGGDLTLEEMLQNMHEAGASNGEMAEVINAAVSDGTISSTESNAWAHAFGVIGSGKNATYEAPDKGRKK